MIRSKIMEHEQLKALVKANPGCASQHFGLWSIEATWFGNAVAAVNAGTWPVEDRSSENEAALDEGFNVTNGIAIIPIVGHMVKGDSSLGGTSTMRARAMVRQAGADDKVKAVMLHIDSPGGTAAGTPELHADIKRLAQHKPVHAHIDDLGASAAMFAAVGADHISINEGGYAGSIGTIAVVQDRSEQFEKEGIKTHVVSTGIRKGDFVDGTPITEDQLSDLRTLVDEHFAFFKSAVADGRRMSGEQVVERFGDGRLLNASDAVSSGLVDSIMPADIALQQLKETTMNDKELADQFIEDHAESASLIRAEGAGNGMAEGERVGVKNERERCLAIIHAFDDSPALAEEHIASGATVQESQAAAAVHYKAQRDEARAANAASTPDDEEQVIGISGLVGANDVVDAGVNEAPEPPHEHATSQEKAEWEWDNKPESRAGFSSKENMVAYRSAEIAGHHRTLSR